MQTLKKVALVVVSFILIDFMIVFAVYWALNSSIGNRDTVKSWFADSGVYENVVDRIIEEAQKEVDKQSDQAPNNDGRQEKNSIETEVLASAVKKAFPPEVLQNATEKALDGTYDWLEGDSKQLQFTIDLSQQKNVLVETLISEARTRLSDLQLCTAANIPTTGDFDVFAINCRPAYGVDEQLQRFQEELSSSDDFLPNPVITAQDLKIDVNGTKKTITEQFSAAPDRYQQAKQLKWIVIIVIIVLTVGVVFLSKALRAGVKHVAIIYILVAVFVAGIGFALSRSITLIKFEQDSIQQTVIKPVASEVSKTTSNSTYQVALAYALVSAAGFVYLRLSKPKSPKEESPTPKEPKDIPAEDYPSTEENRQPEENEVKEKNKT